MNTQATAIGKDTIYICQVCENREKEFAVSSRNYKYCRKCGGISIKATLVDSYNYIITPPVMTETTQGEVEQDEESYE